MVISSLGFQPMHHVHGLFVIINSQGQVAHKVIKGFTNFVIISPPCRSISVVQVHWVVFFRKENKLYSSLYKNFVHNHPLLQPSSLNRTKTKLAKGNKTLETKENAKGQLSLKPIGRHPPMLSKDLRHNCFQKIASPLHGRSYMVDMYKGHITLVPIYLSIHLQMQNDFTHICVQPSCIMRFVSTFRKCL